MDGSTLISPEVPISNFPEWDQLQRLIEKSRPHARILQLGNVEHGDLKIPLQGLLFGPNDASLPCVGLFAGVHGLEKIGTHLALGYLSAFVGRLHWDEQLQEMLQHVRLVAMPLVNPLGMLMTRRSNARGVDLMRNAPVEAESRRHWPVSGQRLTHVIPWYRGDRKAPMEIEAQVLCELVQREIFPSRFALTLDLHSGFGTFDRLWFPYARSRQDFPYKHRADQMAALLDATHPHHVYHIEAQSDSYLASGDLWDHLVDLHAGDGTADARILLPWTLEMGSWAWVRKNPLQLFKLLGPFNPLRPHRHRRTLRRHCTLIDFFLQAAANHHNWSY